MVDRHQCVKWPVGGMRQNEQTATLRCICKQFSEKINMDYTLVGRDVLLQGRSVALPEIVEMTPKRLEQSGKSQPALLKNSYSFFKVTFEWCSRVIFVLFVNSCPLQIEDTISSFVKACEQIAFIAALVTFSIHTLL